MSVFVDDREALQARLERLEADRDRLLPDADDSMALCELIHVEHELARCRTALSEERAA